MQKLIWTILIACTCAPALHAQTSGTQGKPSTIATSVTEAPIVDGRPTDGVWSAAEVVSGFTQSEPMEGSPVSERTEVRIIYDEDALYIAAWLYDRDPAAMVVGETRRDASLQNTDAFLFVLDTYRDGQNGFVFGTTPSGIEYDGQVSNEGQGGGAGGTRQQSGTGAGFNLNWDGTWQVATSQDDDGWYAEFRIPFSTLRYRAGGAQEWGVNFARNIRRNNEESFWAPVPRQFTLFRVSLAGTLSGFEAPSKKIFTVSPFLVADAFKDYSLGTSAEYETEIGGDAKIGLTQSLTLDLTLNTDFAQAEVDDQQVNLTRFPLFFPEKRAFFLENAGSFAVGTPRSTELFFSRRIGLSEGSVVPILGGARLTGKVGGLQVALLNIQANDFNQPTAGEQFPEGDTKPVVPSNNFGVLRVFQEFANRTRLGGIFVSRLNTEDTNDYNLTYGVDGSVGVGQDLTFNGWASATSTPDVSSGEYAFSGGGRYETRDWVTTAGYTEVGAEFNPEVGFLTRDEYRSLTARVQRNIRFDDVDWFRELRPHISYRQFWDLDGFSETYLVHIDSHFEFSNGAFFQLPAANFIGEGLQEPFEIREGIVIPAGSYNNFDWGFAFNTDRSARVFLDGRIDWGGFFSGRRIGTTSTLNYRYEDRFVASFRVAYFDVNLPEGDFVTSVLAVKGTYSFTPSIFFSATLQYDDEAEDLGANFRFAWLNRAGTGLYIVYNDTSQWGTFERTGIPRGALQRQFVIKFSKMFDIGR